MTQNIKALFIAAYPIQNVEPYRVMSQMDDLEVQMVFCTNPSDNLKKDKEFINQAQFDIQVLDEGYSWTILKNRAKNPGLSHFWGLVNPGIVKYTWKADCVIVYGHAYATFWLAILSARLFFKKLVLTTDATHLEAPDGKGWKTKMKKIFFPFLYNHLAHGVYVPSSASKNFLVSLGVKAERITITPYTVDNQFIQAQIKNPHEIRERHGIPSDAVVAIFCAKFIDRKRPPDAILAFAKCKVSNSYLLMIGDGPLRLELEKLIEQLGLQQQVILAGLVNYSQLPTHYASADFLVFTSETEQFGLPVNEAMLCGLPVLISDRIGCRFDLVEEGKNGFTYPCGNVEALAEKMKLLFIDTQKRKAMSQRSREIIQNWSPEANAIAKQKSITELVGPI